MKLAGITLALVTTAALSAQQRGPAPAPASTEEAIVTPGEVQRMFDSYALMQAEPFLQLREDQFALFLTRFRALQDARRKGLAQHAKILGDIRKLLAQPEPDDAAIREQMKALDEADRQTQADVKRSSDGIDQVLDLRQQAKFRVFEEAMERRKLELVTKARQPARKP